MIVDSKPFETKKLSRIGRHGRRGGSSLIKEGVGPVKEGFYRIQDNLLHRWEEPEPPLHRPTSMI
jgi:hypothetical protein